MHVRTKITKAEKNNILLFKWLLIYRDQQQKQHQIEKLAAN
jgi:hypothetical protein